MEEHRQLFAPVWRRPRSNFYLWVRPSPEQPLRSRVNLCARPNVNLDHFRMLSTWDWTCFAQAEEVQFGDLNDRLAGPW